MSSRSPPAPPGVMSAYRDGLQKCLAHLEGIQGHVRRALADSIESINPRARYFHHLQEPVDLPHTIQAMMRKAETITQEEFSSHMFDIISRAAWEICQQLHLAESKLFHGVEVLRAFLDLDSQTDEQIREHVKGTYDLIEHVGDFQVDLSNRMALTTEQLALYHAREEPNLEQFVQDSADMAFRNDSREVLSLESAEGFLQGIQKAATKVLLDQFHSRLKSLVKGVQDSWKESIHSIQANKRQKK
ncbi:hypothetical protein KCU92_g9005, partial [Aureobasidium melanogenum]